MTLYDGQEMDQPLSNPTNLKSQAQTDTGRWCVYEQQSTSHGPLVQFTTEAPVPTFS